MPESAFFRVSLLTDIVTPARATKRRLLYLDNDEWRMTSSDAVKDLDLRIGHDQPLQDLSLALHEAEQRMARERAIRLLTYSDRSSHEVRRRLTEDGYPEAVAQATVSDLERIGLIDDARYADAMARVFTAARGYGSVRAVRELCARGIDPEMATDAVAESLSAEAEAEAAAQLARALATRRGADAGRVAARLFRKGFPADLAFRAARAAFEDLAGNDD